MPLVASSIGDFTDHTFLPLQQLMRNTYAKIGFRESLSFPACWSLGGVPTRVHVQPTACVLA